MKLAVTVLLEVMCIVQLAPTGSSHPDHDEKAEPAAGFAVSNTVWLVVYVSVQSEPQLMPCPETWPAPVPDRLTVNVEVVLVPAVVAHASLPATDLLVPSLAYTL